MKRRTSCVTGLCVGLLVTLGACGDDDDVAGPTGPFTLTFQGDLTFSGPHEGHILSAAVVRIFDGVVVAMDTTTIEADTGQDLLPDASFFIGFPVTLVAGEAYEVHYWIDSNLGGGTVGVCDAKAIDHQWKVAVATVVGPVTISEIHDATMTTDVCSTFFAAPNLAFAGDASFEARYGAG